MNERIDDTVVRFLRRWSIVVLRVSVAVVFIWFGALKVFDVTPVADLVGDTVYWVDPDWFVPLLGVFEIAVGMGLLVRRYLRTVLGLFALQMVGTFLVLVVQPEVAFQDGNPLLLTVDRASSSSRTSCCSRRAWWWVPRCGATERSCATPSRRRRRSPTFERAHTLRGTEPNRVRIGRMILWPTSAVGPNMQGQPPWITSRPCSRPRAAAAGE